MRAVAAVLIATACASPSALDDREQRIVTALRDDNYLWAARDPALVAMKLAKMQRSPYDWLRGTASLFWRDELEPGGDRAATAFGDPRSSRVLLVGDPHPENVGTFRAGDGRMIVDWNDLDASGYGPFTLDVRRLASGLVLAVEDDPSGEELVRRVARGYATTMAQLATGARIGPISTGEHPLLDEELEKARSRGGAHTAIAEIAPIVGGARAVAYGDLEEAAEDEVIEDRFLPVSPEEAAWIDRAVATWRAGLAGPARVGEIVVRGRRIGAGVSSYAALRYNVVLSGASSDVDDDLIVELKETREGAIVRGVPQLQSAEWPTPAARAVDTQRRLHARPDADPLLGAAQVGALSLKIRDREAYQRGLSRDDLAELAAGSAAKRVRLLALAEVLGGMLARAHGQTSTADGVVGWRVIAPLLAGRETPFADELVARALADAARIAADYELLKGHDLMVLVFPEGYR